jgi:CBS domain-containing protein
MTNRQMSEIIRRQKPTTLRPTATVREACQTIHERRIGAVLVTDEQDWLLGIFTGRDAVRVLAEARDPVRTVLKDVMTRNPIHSRREKCHRRTAPDAGRRDPARACRE